MTNNTAITSFDRLATETILEIFEYLSSSDLLYAFYNSNHRLNSILLTYEYFLHSVNFSTGNFDVWQHIFSKIGPGIRQLTITTRHFRFPLDMFPNLESLIICSPFEIKFDEFSLILDSSQIQKLKSFQFQSEICDNRPYFNYINEFFTHIFHAQSSLHTFEWLSTLDSSYLQLMINTLEINRNIHSLSLKLCGFRGLDCLLRCTPNLKDLNLTGSSFISPQNSLSARQMPVIRLDKFSFTASIDGSVNWSYKKYISPLIDLVKQFSSSLTVLSIDLSHKYILEDRMFIINRLAADFLPLTIQLKIFRFYVRLEQSPQSSVEFLTTFIDANWPFGMHGSYLYTLPFPFNQLDDFIDFDHIQSTNSTIVNSRRTWSHVQSLNLADNCNLSENLLEQIRVQMPNLKSINLKRKQIDYLSKLNEVRTALNGIITVHGERDLLKSSQNYFNHLFPNVKQFVLSYSPLTIIHLSHKLAFAQRCSTSLTNDQLGRNKISFPRIQHVEAKLQLEDIRYLSKHVLPVLIEISEMFANIKSFQLTFYCIQKNPTNIPFTELHQLIRSLNMNQICKDFSIEHISNQLQFVKKEQ